MWEWEIVKIEKIEEKRIGRKKKKKMAGKEKESEESIF
jgi:hypothetical protein